MNNDWRTVFLPFVDSLGYFMERWSRVSKVTNKCIVARFQVAGNLRTEK